VSKMPRRQVGPRVQRGAEKDDHCEASAHKAEQVEKSEKRKGWWESRNVVDPGPEGSGAVGGKGQEQKALADWIGAERHKKHGPTRLEKKRALGLSQRGLAEADGVTEWIVRVAT